MTNITISLEGVYNIDFRAQIGDIPVGGQENSSMIMRVTEDDGKELYKKLKAVYAPRNTTEDSTNETTSDDHWIELGKGNIHMKNENEYEPGFYTTQSGYLVGVENNDLFFYFADDMQRTFCTRKWLMDEIYGKSEFPLRKCDSIKYGKPKHFEEPEEDGVYITQSGKFIWRRSDINVYRWVLLEIPMFYTNDWKDMVDQLGYSEFPLRRITKDGYEPVDSGASVN